jgi:hypothetical protein
MLSFKSESVSSIFTRCALLSAIFLAGAGSGFGQISTSTNATLAPSPVDQGTTPVATVTVTASDGSTPDSSVTCAIQTRGHNASYSAALEGGVASISLLSIAQDPIGNYTLACSYAGSSNYAASSANTISFSIISPISTTTTVSVAPSPVTYGSSPVATVTVTASDGTIPTGSVSCNIQTRGHNAAYSSALTNGSASLPLTSIAQDPVGTYSFVCSYAGSSSYTASSSSTTSLNVTQAVPVITWSSPASIAAGTALSATQLDATASVAGTFVYSPAAGTVPSGGTDTLSVTFTPTDTTDYTTTAKTVSVTVGQATPVITWATPAAITYGTALSATQLDATASVAGTFAYTPAAGNIPAQGTDTLSVTFTPSNSAEYMTVTQTVGLTVSDSSTMTTVSVFPTTTYAGNPITVTVNATDSEGLSLSGNVNCSSTGTQQLTFSATLSNGTATWTTPALQLGAYSFSCNYLGTTGFNASASQSVAETVEAVPQPTWTLTGSMSSGVYLQTATLLPSGNVLIAGGNDNGYGDEGAVLSAEIYNPSTGLFASTGPMADARFGHTATLLTSGPNSGDVLIVGGEDYADTELQEAELYSYQSASFGASSGKPNYPRSMHTATQLHDGTILVAGGYTGCIGCGTSNLAPAEIYNPVQQVFTTVGSLNTPRYAHTATLLPNGDVLIVGGINNNGTITNTAELYNPTSKTFSATGNLITARAYHSATYLPDGQVLIAGGLNASGTPLNTAELYNPATGEFIVTGQLNAARYTHGSALVYSGNVLVYGGVTNSNGATTVTAEQYNPQSGQWTTTTSLNDARYFAATILLPNGKVLAAGGMNYSSGNYTQLSSAEIYSLNNSYITGFVNPKYIVLGVTYAPPGPSSYVSYANTTTLGTTTMISDSTSDENGISTSVSETFAIPGLQAIGIGNSVTETGTDSSQNTQDSNNSTTVTLSKTMTQMDKTTGTGDVYNPVNHDYDIVWLWLNPLEIFTINAGNPSEILWNGDGYDPNDEPAMDVYPVLVGNLNGDIPMDQSMQNELSRAWADNDQTWPVGQGPGLGATDYQQIIGADPFAGCTYNTAENEWDNCPYAGSHLNAPLAPPVNSDDGRFSIYSGNQSVPYVQAGPGNGAGLTGSYQNSVTNTTSVANGTSYTQQQSFSLETGFSITANIPLNIFSNAISVKTTYSHTFKTTQTYQQTISTTTTQQDMLSITGPGCSQTSPPCSPQYVGPPQFVIYQDNLFGSYMFYPVN